MAKHTHNAASIPTPIPAQTFSGFQGPKVPIRKTVNTASQPKGK